PAGGVAAPPRGGPRGARPPAGGGRPDETLGESVCAVVVLEPGAELTLAGARAWLLERGVARFRLPDRLAVVDALPLTAIGKIDKKLLRARIE
ncbi:MAG: hypothetical protein IRZ08_17675, partial [Frankia sp.]|nr:hypothetical protein [Frankia sp.]